MHQKEMLMNFKKNWYLPLSAFSFFFLQSTITLSHVLAIIVAILLVSLIACNVTSIYENIKDCKNKRLKIFSILTTLGICLWGQTYNYKIWQNSLELQTIQSYVSIDLSACISILFAVLSFVFVYICVFYFWKKINLIINSAIEGINKKEQILYIILFLCVCIFVSYIFLKTDAFYGSNKFFDVIYTSDSSALVQHNAFLSLLYSENDLRQPLFAVFAAPFVGAAYFVGSFFSFPIQVLFMNYTQIAMLIFSNFILTKIMKLDLVKRVSFMLLSCCSYTFLLFVLMMEQYITAFFFLMLFLYQISENKNDFMLFSAASGTLLTSAVLLPLMSRKRPLKVFKAWFKDMFFYGISFIIVMMLFCRLDIFLDFFTNVGAIKGFTGSHLTLIDKLIQFNSYMSNCIFAPKAGIDFESYKHVSWQLENLANFDTIGIILFIIILLSVFLNRNKQITKIAFTWFIFSFITLCLCGWGTSENGLILYSLYFGWPIIVLLFLFFEKIIDIFHNKILFLGISIIGCFSLLYFNIPGILSMIDFAITYYPLN